MAPRIEEEGAIARLGASFESKVELFGHRFSVDSAAARQEPAPADADGKNLILVDNPARRRPFSVSPIR